MAQSRKEIYCIRKLTTIFGWCGSVIAPKNKVFLSIDGALENQRKLLDQSRLSYGLCQACITNIVNEFVAGLET